MGATINFIILYFLGAEALGVFYQVYAIYVIVGQVAVWGLHDSVLKYTSQYTDSQERDTLCFAAIFCVLMTGTLGATLLLLSRDFIGQLFESKNLRYGIIYLSPGILFFVINKVLVAIFNGKRQMKYFALASAIRAVNIFALCIFLIINFDSLSYFGFVFTTSEILLFLVIIFLKPTGLLIKKDNIKQWISRHYQFGTKSVGHGLLSEAFIRVDVLMLGIFLSDTRVGIYSFAAFFVEGIYQIPVVIRNLNNPILVKMLIEKNVNKLIDFTRKTAKLSVTLTFSASVLVVIAYPYLDFIFKAETIDASYSVLLVLLSGMVLYSIFIPFDYIFITGGFPGIQSIFMSINMTSNIGLNYLLIPHYGLMGAAIATVSAFAFSCLLLNVLSIFYLSLPKGVLLK